MDIFIRGLVGLILLTVLCLMAYVGTFKPEVLVKWQAQFYRRTYKGLKRMSDQEIDQKIPRAWFFFMIDSMSHFVNRGPEHPEEFPRLLKYVRILGYAIWAMLFVAAILLLYGAVPGGPR